MDEVEFRIIRLKVSRSLLFAARDVVTFPMVPVAQGLNPSIIAGLTWRPASLTDTVGHCLCKFDMVVRFIRSTIHIETQTAKLLFDLNDYGKCREVPRQGSFLNVNFFLRLF